MTVNRTPWTPGPYSFRKCGSFAYAIEANWHGEVGKIAVVDAGICTIRGPHADENMANATLIAAAPELAAELRRVTDLLASWTADHSMDCTAEIDAALYCARALLERIGG
jgi:hypothetical protein